MVDKNQAVIDFLATYEDIQNNPLFFNFINAKDSNYQFLTTSNDNTLNRSFIDGSVAKQYLFTLVITKTITDLAIVKEQGIANENLEDMANIQALMDWVNEQDELQNYPNFGEQCVIEEMKTTSENPNLDGINTDVTPALALYSMSIRIDYIDYSKIIWK